MIVSDFPCPLVLTLYIVTPSSCFLIPSLGGWPMTKLLPASIVISAVDQIEYSISPHKIMFRINGGRQHFGVFVPIFLNCVRDVHLQSSRQCLHHSVCAPIRLRSVRHGRTLFLPHDPNRRSIKIGHRFWLSIMAGRFTGPKSSNQIHFEISSIVCGVLE